MMINKKVFLGLVLVSIALGNLNSINKIDIKRPAAMLWNYDNMLKIKAELKNGKAEKYSKAYDDLIKGANKLLTEKAPSVMDKPDDCVAISGDKHDFITVGKYSWPNPNTPDGKPWIQKDGVRNPNYIKYDATYQGKMCKGVMSLSIAYFFSNDERYAQKAVEFIKVWFLNSETKMNPHFKYAQVIPGNDGDNGHNAGIIEGRVFVDVLSSVGLLRQSPSYSKVVDNGLKDWFYQYCNWLTTSSLGLAEGRNTNNHAVAYDEQLLSSYLFLGETEKALTIINDLHPKRLFLQIELDGSMPLELKRTLGFSYSEYNLIHMLEMCEMAKELKPDLYNVTSGDGRCIGKALDYISKYLGKTVEEFAPYKQISGWDDSQQHVCWLIYRARNFDPQKNYEDLFHKYWKEKPGHINLLIY